MEYTKASAEVVLFDNSDVITTSGYSTPGEAWTGCDLPSASQQDCPAGGLMWN